MRDIAGQGTPPVENGQFFPKMKLYPVGTVVQLVCDQGYEVASMSNTAKCFSLTSKFGVNRAVFNYGQLACVRSKFFYSIEVFQKTFHVSTDDI